MLSIPEKDWRQIKFKKNPDLTNSVPGGDYLDQEIFDIGEHEINCILTAEQVLKLSYQVKRKFFIPFLQNSKLAKELLELIKSRATIGSLYENAVKFLLSFAVPSEIHIAKNTTLKVNKRVNFKQLNRVFSKNN